MRIQIVGTIASFLLLIGCVTAPQEMSDEALSDEVFRYSGIQDSLSALPDTIQSSLKERQKQSKLTDEQFDLLASTMRTYFRPGELRETIFGSIDRGLTRQDKIKIVSFYRSESGQQIRQAELHMNTLAGQERFSQWLKELEEDKADVSKDDIEYAKNLAIHTGALELSVESIAAVTIGMIVGLNASLPEDKRMNSKEVNEQTKKIKDALYEQMAPAIIITMHYTYKDLSKDNKQLLLEFVQKDAGKKFIETIAKSLSKGFTVAAEKVGDSLAKQLTH
jgi:hypothetical protein